MDNYEKTWPDYKALGMRAEKAAAEIPNTEKKWAEYKSGIQEARKLADVAGLRKPGLITRRWKPT